MRRIFVVKLIACIPFCLGFHLLVAILLGVFAQPALNVSRHVQGLRQLSKSLGADYEILTLSVSAATLVTTLFLATSLNRNVSGMASSEAARRRLLDWISERVSALLGLTFLVLASIIFCNGISRLALALTLVLLGLFLMCLSATSEVSQSYWFGAISQEENKLKLLTRAAVSIGDVSVVDRGPGYKELKRTSWRNPLLVPFVATSVTGTMVYILAFLHVAGRSLTDFSFTVQSSVGLLILLAVTASFCVFSIYHLNMVASFRAEFIDDPLGAGLNFLMHLLGTALMGLAFAQWVTLNGWAEVSGPIAGYGLPWILLPILRKFHWWREWKAAKFHGKILQKNKNIQRFCLLAAPSRNTGNIDETGLSRTSGVSGKYLEVRSFVLSALFVVGWQVVLKKIQGRSSDA